jgi:hypothetical protein
MTLSKAAAVSTAVLESAGPIYTGRGRCCRASRATPSRRRARCAGLASPATLRDNPRLRLLIGSKGMFLIGALSAHGARLLHVVRGIKVRMEGVEPSWPLDRRLLRPVRIPVPPHPHDEPQARSAERAARRFMRQAGGAATRAVPPRAAPFGEPPAARLWPGAEPAWGVPRPERGGDASPPPLCLEGRTRRPPVQRAPRAQSEMRCGVAVSKPTTSSIPWSSGRRSRSS